MRYAGTERDDDSPWFRLGQLDVNTAVLVLLVWSATLLVWIVEGPGRGVTNYLWLNTDAVVSGEVWRLVTWPFAHLTFRLGDIINAAVFWLFATDLERQIGRRPFTWLAGLSVVVIGVAGTVLAQLLGDPPLIWDLSLLSLTVVLLYCAEHPTRPFFFNIPAWAIGAVIVALEVVNDLANRDVTRLLTVIVAAAIIALIAKRVGLLSMYERVPEVKLPGHDRAPAGSSPRASKSKPKSSEGGLGARFGRRKEAEIVEMPQPAQRFNRPQRVEPVEDVNADDVLLDALLDKISAGGIDSLTADERRQLDEIRDRRRQD